MDIEKNIRKSSAAADENTKTQPETSYLYEKLLEAFEFMTERVADVFTYSKFIEFNGGPLPNDNDKQMIENMIHQLRINIRQDFRNTFFDLSVKYKLKESLHSLTFEIEKARILKEFDDITGQLFSQGSDYYFQFLAGVVKRLKETNEEVKLF